MNNKIPFFILAFIGLANALPIPLSGTVLSVWLSEVGFDRAFIGLFALMGLPFSIKLLWSPLVDQISLPFFEEKPRKGWMILSLLGMSGSLCGMSLINPLTAPWSLAFCLLSLSLFTGCLYIVGLAYELESLEETSYQRGSACVVTGYRIGLLSAGGGGLYLALLWDWSSMYLFMAALLGFVAFLIFLSPEPIRSKEVILAKRLAFSSHNSLFEGFFKETLLKPIKNFFERKDAFLILALVVGFKCGSQMSKTMEGPFYLSLGFNKADLAMAAKFWGFSFTILGTFFLSLFIKGKNPFSMVALTGCLHAFSLYFHTFLSLFGKSYIIFYSAIALENLTGGLAMASFIYLLWRICDKRYAAVQYALLWSLFSFKGDFLACCGGLLASFCSWPLFFLVAGTTGLFSSLILFFAFRKKSYGLQLGSIPGRFL